MNLSHVIHEFSFGPFFPRISQPLDNSVEMASSRMLPLTSTYFSYSDPSFADFHIFQYFISVVATQYIDAGRRKLDTNQYSVTDMARETEHGKGVPGTYISPILWLGS